MSRSNATPEVIMPIYEYYCFDCRKKVTLFFRTVSAAQDATPLCPICGSERLHRLVSRVAVVHSEEDRLDRLMEDESLLAGLESEDPRTLAKFMRTMQNELGEDMDDPELGEMIDRLEAGESPEAIEASLGLDDTSG
ncbi:MAG TPA: zinc ribbon domain-containing protein [Caldilineales bacterium]|nr:zinc ribbon domain-containing protein [Caldilineales bacterium]